MSRLTQQATTPVAPVLRVTPEAISFQSTVSESVSITLSEVASVAITGHAPEVVVRAPPATPPADDAVWKALGHDSPATRKGEALAL
jgi:hypothetical protein